VDTHELKGSLTAMSLTLRDRVVTDADVNVWILEFDKDGDGLISRPEFCAGMAHWVLELTRAPGFGARTPPLGRRTSTHVEPVTGLVSRRSERRQSISGLEPLLGATTADSEVLRRAEEAAAEEEEDDDDEADEADEGKSPTKAQIIRKSAVLLGGGMALIALFADPMVGAVTSLSKSLGLPSPFFASFVLTPFASNASELVSSLYFASKKRKKNISLTYSQVYGAVTMNNTMCLGLFMVVMYSQGLEWTFTSETLTILLVTLVVGGGAHPKTKAKPEAQSLSINQLPHAVCRLESACRCHPVHLQAQ
jgi:hypothetical protein